MSISDTPSVEPKYFDLMINGLGYLSRLRLAWQYRSGGLHLL